MGDGQNRVGGGSSFVGYIVRLESKISSYTRLTFCTTGVLLRRLESDPDLSGVSHVVVDEVHERALDSDFLLILLRRLVLRRAGTLKVILMSATADAEMFKGYFEQSISMPTGSHISCPVVTVPGRTFPVQAFFIEDAVEATGYVIEAGSEYGLKNVVTRRDAGTATISGKGGKTYQMKLEWEEVTQSGGGIVDVPRAAQQDIVEDDDELDGDGEEHLEAMVTAGSYSQRALATLSQMDPRRIDLDLLEHLIRYVVDNVADDTNKNAEDHGMVGSVLVFLPGLAEIRRMFDRLTSEGVRDNRYRTNMYVLPLHSVLGTAEQAKGNVNHVCCDKHIRLISSSSLPTSASWLYKSGTRHKYSRNWYVD
jgi:ATP-dependent RNA helicase DHX29